MDLKERRYELLRASVPAQAFGKYQMEASYEPLREVLNERKYRAGDTRVSARVLAHWDKIGLIPDGVRGGSDGWRKFSLVEMVCLRAVLHLRDFGLSLERILRVKQEVIHWAERTKEYPNRYHDCYPYFEFCIAETLSGAEIYVHVSADGSARLMYLEQIEMGKIFGYYSHGLLISFRSILKELHLDFAEGRNWFNLSDNEMKMLTEIRKEGSREIRARVKDLNLEVKKVVEIDSAEMYSENPSLSDIRKLLQGQGAFAEVIMSLENGKEQSVEVIRKKKPK